MKKFYDFKKTKFDEKMFENFSKHFLSTFFFQFFFAGGLAPPHLPQGLCPWTPHAFGLKTPASQVLAQWHSIRTGNVFFMSVKL